MQLDLTLQETERLRHCLTEALASHAGDADEQLLKKLLEKVVEAESRSTRQLAVQFASSYSPEKPWAEPASIAALPANRRPIANAATHGVDSSVPAHQPDSIFFPLMVVPHRTSAPAT